MEFWPADFRKDTPSTSTKKRRKGKATYVNEQCLEPGSLGAATLISNGGSPEWVTAVQPRRENIPRVVGKPLEVFPPTKQLLPSIPRLSVHQRAEQGARFLRTYHPDVDIPFELIKDELQSDEEEAAADLALDPYAGNRLVHSSFENKRKQRIHFLAFSSGETGSDLNVSPFRVTREKQVVFSPSAAPALSFDTPIQQLVSFSSGVCYRFSLLAVRTHSTVSFVKIQDSSTSQAERPSLTATTVARISLADTGQRRVVDVSGCLFSSSNAQALLVNDMGVVYNCKVEGEKMIVNAVSAQESRLSVADQFWRVVRKDVNIGLLNSSKTVQMLDMRGRTPAQLFELKNDLEFLTSIEAPTEGRHLMCISTTRNLMWIDERNHKSPVLSIAHHRNFDRTLRAETVSFGSSPFTLLFSSVNSLVTVYDVNYGSSGHVHAYGGPSILFGSSSLDFPFEGSTLVSHTAERSPFVNMFQLSSRGSLWRTRIAYSQDSEARSVPDSPQDLEWTEDMHTLAAKYTEAYDQIPPFGGREYLDANLRVAYEKIFQMHQTPSETSPVDAEAIYQTLDKMPIFWQDMDGPAEHMLLTFDVAFRSGVEPSHASRADFLTGSLLSSPQGFVALTRGRVPVPRLVSTALWHHDLKSLPSSMVPNIATMSQAFIDEFREEALAHAATAEGMKRAIDATQHVALDLALSRHIYAPQAFSQPQVAPINELDDSNLLSQATKAMSLEVPEPPPVQFGFLRPVTKGVYEEDEQVEESDPIGARLPLSIRLLLSQWEVGTDPQKYAYEDPYNGPDATPPLRKPASAKITDLAGGRMEQQTAVPPVISLQRVPPVVASTSRPLGSAGPPVRTNSIFPLGRGPIPDTYPNDTRQISSQDVNRPSTYVFSSQEQGPSTQPLPGAFGGGIRQQKHKGGKKRMGGF